jgi:selenocysteine-specific elongation factor
MEADLSMSDRDFHAPRGIVIGTAGHIDHGKTSLVGALTGMDTDRLSEEKRRGISIDLGFAHLTLPDGERIAFIDVPGHERFIKNMLAGAGGIEAVMLVVASDESVKPQTREHFDICRLLNLKQGLIVLTKCDLTTEEQLATTEEEVKQLCFGSFLQGAPIVRVSALTGEGLPELKQRLSSLAKARVALHNTGLTRLPLDRSFAVKGFGTVVTGTLWGGALRTGETIEIQPLKRKVRIRGLQVHGDQVEIANAGQRTAVNLAGIEHSELKRGFVLTTPGALETTALLDVEVDWLQKADLPKRRGQFFLHLGTAEVVAYLKVTDAIPETRALARLWLSEPILGLPGDRFVLRHASSARTVAGGFILDPFPPKRLGRAKAARRLHALRNSDEAGRIEILVSESGVGRRTSELTGLTGLTLPELMTVIANNPALLFLDGAQRVVSKDWVDQRREKLVHWLNVFHAEHPSAAGAPVSAARLGLETALADAVFSNFTSIRVQGDTIALATHKARFSHQDTAALSGIEQVFRNAGFQPPSITHALNASGQTNPQKARDLLETLIKNRRLVRLSEDLVFHADVIAHIHKSLAAHQGRRFSVPEFKQWTQISRKYAIPLLEYLDHQKITRREGDLRVVL